LKPLCTVLVILLLLSGCAATKPAHLQAKARDAAGDLNDFSAVMIRITKLLLHKAGAAGNDAAPGNESGDAWASISVPFDRREFDLAAYSEGQSWEFFNQTVAPGAYSQLRLSVERAQGTLKNGDKVRLDVAPLVFGTPLTLKAGRTTSIVADLEVVKTGDAKYRLQPNLDRTTVAGPA
jgi:hypothetical protein